VDSGAGPWFGSEVLASALSGRSQFNSRRIKHDDMQIVAKAGHLLPRMPSDRSPVETCTFIRNAIL
jgi:hypothetical protein